MVVGAAAGGLSPQLSEDKPPEQIESQEDSCMSGQLFLDKKLDNFVLSEQHYNKNKHKSGHDINQSATFYKSQTSCTSSHIMDNLKQIEKHVAYASANHVKKPQAQNVNSNYPLLHFTHHQPIRIQNLLLTPPTACMSSMTGTEPTTPSQPNPSTSSANGASPTQSFVHHRLLLMKSFKLRTAAKSCQRERIPAQKTEDNVLARRYKRGLQTALGTADH